MLLHFSIYLFSPVFSWVHSRSELRPSPRLPGCYDQPVEASNWLKNFRAANSEFLGQVSQSVISWES